MIFGTTTYTFIHVLISLAGIASGLVVLQGLIASNHRDGWTLVFLATTVATSATGFGFTFKGVTPAIILGVLSLVVLAAAIAARYAFGLRGAWRWIYAAGAVTALYFNVFVLIVQSFAKIGPLHALAPTGSEPPFAIVQALALALFVLAGVRAVRRFHPAAAASTASA